MDKVIVQAHFIDGSMVNINHKSFNHAITSIINCSEKLNTDVLIILFPGTTTKLLWDKSAFSEYLRGGISKMELVEQTQVDALYRNVFSQEFFGDFVDVSSLWKRKSNRITLVDDDRHIEIDFIEKNFTQIF